jgi:hypothetical protein
LVKAMYRPVALLLVAILAGGFFPAVAAPEHLWPEKPIRIIVPGGVGGVTDVRARWLAEPLALALRQPVIVENKPGAGGNIGTEAGARSAPDGYTLIIVHQGTMTMNPHLYSRTGYDPLTDFAPITRLGVGPLVLTVNPAVPARNVSEHPSSPGFIAKSRPYWRHAKRSNGLPASGPSRASRRRRPSPTSSAASTRNGERPFAKRASRPNDDCSRARCAGAGPQ